MSLSTDFDNLTESFKKVLTNLQSKSDANITFLEKNFRGEYVGSTKTLQDFKNLITGITDTCSELVTSSKILKEATKPICQENTLKLPYEIHSDFVECINQLYNMSNLGDKQKGRIINEKKKEMISELVKTCERSVENIKDVEDAIAETKDIL